MENQKICIAVKHPQRKRESAGLTEVRQSEHGLTELPLSLLRSLSNLRTIDFSHNLIESIPLELTKIRTLTNINLSHNRIEEVPVAFAHMTQLQCLDLSHNRIAELHNAHWRFAFEPCTEPKLVPIAPMTPCRTLSNGYAWPLSRYSPDVNEVIEAFATRVPNVLQVPAHLQARYGKGRYLVRPCLSYKPLAHHQACRLLLAGNPVEEPATFRSRVYRMREQDEAVAPAALADDTASTLDKAKKQSHEREEALRSKLLRQANKERTLVRAGSRTGKHISLGD